MANRRDKAKIPPRGSTIDGTTVLFLGYVNLRRGLKIARYIPIIPTLAGGENAKVGSKGKKKTVG